MDESERAVRGEAARLRLLMCPPEHFTVEYAINPWMDPGTPVDTALARRQWEHLRSVYSGLGHEVVTIEPVPGLPDMVFAANGATVVGGAVLGARFRFPERAAEAGAYLSWFRAHGYHPVVEPGHVNEGEGDLAFISNLIVAGYGMRSEKAAADEAAKVFGVPVVSVRLVDPRFYHLDTALLVLDARTAAWYPAAFDTAGRAALAGVFPELIEATEADARELGLNGLSDGGRVVLPAQAAGLAGRIEAAGFTVVPVDMSEFKKSGGGPKCCTLVLR